MTHYAPKILGGGWYGFTSPLGTHHSHWSYDKCLEMIGKVRARHVERSREDGHEASILANYFDREGKAPEPEPPKKAMEEHPCTGRQARHDWTYNEATGHWHCSACDTDKRDFDRALRDRSTYMMRESRKKQKLSD